MVWNLNQLGKLLQICIGCRVFLIGWLHLFQHFAFCVQKHNTGISRYIHFLHYSVTIHTILKGQ